MTDTSCLNCKHFNFDNWGTCEAFPKGIPVEITFGAVNHFDAYGDDGGIQFEPLPATEDAAK